MSKSGMRCLEVLYLLRNTYGSGGVGLACIVQFANVSRSTAHRQMKKAHGLGYLEVYEEPYREGIACRYRLSDLGVDLMEVPF